MEVIITGGTGLIGRALSMALVTRGDKVVVLSRDPEGARNMPPGVRISQWDGRSAAGWTHLVNNADAIINLAGENIAAGQWTAERKRRISESRLNAGKAVMEAIAAVEQKPRVLIQASAVGYYGHRDTEVATEETRPGDNFLAQVVIAWEASTEPVERLGVRRVIIRTGIVLSQDGGALPRMLLPFRFFMGGPLGSGKQLMPWIHIADEVGAILFLLNRDDAVGPFNLTAPGLVTNAEFNRVLGRVIKRPTFMAVPAFALKFVLGEMAQIVLEGQRAIPKRLLELGYAFEFPALEGALRNILRC